MLGRIIGAVIALCGVGLLALVLINGGPEPVAAYSRREEGVLVLGAVLCIGGVYYFIRGSHKPDLKL